MCLVIGLTLLALVSASSSATLASELSNRAQDIIDSKNANLSGNVNTPPKRDVGGDVIGTATPIPALPYSDVGNTCSFTNDYDESCPFTDSTSPDVVYSYMPGSDQQVTFDICDSGYDTKIYVYESAAGNPIACNDDGCTDPSGNPYRSVVLCVYLTAGNTYYIVIDGYFGDCGSYNLTAFNAASCPELCDGPICPRGALAEGEPDCFNEYVDTLNAGCLSDPPSFSTLPCQDGVTICGTSGVYSVDGATVRDTDWYRIDVGPTPCSLMASACATFKVQLAIRDGNSECDPYVVTCGPSVGEAGTVVSCGPITVSGTVWIFMSTAHLFIDPPTCGSEYALWIDTSCCPRSAAESRSWGSIKGLYR